jgi:hypothetical protein
MYVCVGVTCMKQLFSVFSHSVRVVCGCVCVWLPMTQLHSLHCLLDVSVCLESPFEILVDPSMDDELYARGWRVAEEHDDGAGKALLIDTGRTVGSSSCGTCYGTGSQQQGFRAVVNATVVAMADPDIDAPTLIVVHQAFPTNTTVSQNPCQEFFAMEQTALAVEDSDKEIADGSDNDLAEDNGSDNDVAGGSDNEVADGSDNETGLETGGSGAASSFSGMTWWSGSVFILLIRCVWYQ